LNGEIAGGTFGCNYQTSNFVLGIEDDLSWTNKKGSASDQLPFNPFAISETNEKWIDTLRGRAGFAWERVFLFATGGGAGANIGVNVCNTIRAIWVGDSPTCGAGRLALESNAQPGTTGHSRRNICTSTLGRLSSSTRPLATPLRAMLRSPMNCSASG
jgi:outer membrane immunogenic protein